MPVRHALVRLASDGGSVYLDGVRIPCARFLTSRVDEQGRAVLTIEVAATELDMRQPEAPDEGVPDAAPHG